MTKATIIVFMSKEQKSHLGYDLGFRSVGTWCSVNSAEVFPLFVFILVDAQNGGEWKEGYCLHWFGRRYPDRRPSTLLSTAGAALRHGLILEFSHLSRLSDFHMSGLLADVQLSCHLSYKKENVTFKLHILRQAPQLQRTDVMCV